MQIRNNPRREWRNRTTARRGRNTNTTVNVSAVSELRLDARTERWLYKVADRAGCSADTILQFLDDLGNPRLKEPCIPYAVFNRAIEEVIHA